MARIQTYSAENAVTGVPGGRRASGVDFATGEGHRDVAEASAQTAKVLNEIQFRRDELEYHKQVSDFRLQSMKRAEEINLSELPEGSDLVKEYEKDFVTRSKALKIPRSQQQRATQDLENMRVSYMGEAISESSRRAGEKAKLDWQEIVTANANMAALSPAKQAEALKTLESASQGLPVDPATRDALLHEGRQSIRAAGAITTIRSNPSAFLAEAKAGKWSDLENLTKYIGAADNEIERLNAGARDEIREDAGKIADAAKLGLTIPRETIEGIAQRASSAGMEKEAVNLREYAVIQDDANEFALKSLTDQSREIEALKVKIESGNLDSVPKYEALAGVLDTKVKMLKTDPWAYYSAHDIVRSPEPMNLGNAQSVGQALEARRADIARVRELEGFDLPLIVPNEIDQLKTMYETGKPQQVATVLTSLGENLDLDGKRALSQAIALKEPMLAAAMNQPPDVAMGILAGAKAHGDVTADKVRISVNEKLSGLVFDSETNESFHGAVYAYYKQLSLQAGDTAKEVNPGRLEKAIEDVVGKPVSISPKMGSPDSRILSYRDDSGEYVSENKLEDILGSVTDPMLTGLNGELPYASDGDKVPAADIVKNARFLSAGDGKYLAVYEGLGVVTYRDGRPYVFDARAIGAYK